MKKTLLQKMPPRKKEVNEVDITSLLDVLVILLVFLLSVYSSSPFEVELAEDLTLPFSSSQKFGSQAPVIQVDKYRNIWLDKDNIGTIDFDDSSEHIDFLALSLEKIKAQREKEEEGRSPKRSTASNARDNDRKRINILLDENLPYEVIQKIMHTSALEGFNEFKLIVQGGQ
ncbi:MAG: biopolymer transporter ExbD [Bacteriovoracales bacterium]|nr:biopolymer transporter ExbD [Bacteriovoracales bacterium]